MDEWYSIKMDSNSIIALDLLKYLATIEDISNQFMALGYDNKNNVKLKLDYGEFETIYKINKIKIKYYCDTNIVGDSMGTRLHEILILSAETKQILLDLFEDSRIYSDKKGGSRIVIRVMKNGFWSTLSSLPKRNLDTLFLEKDILNDAVNDVKSFINNEEEYINNGIPYKRNYLLTGPPGTGKTSLIFTIASELNLDINIINFGPTVDDYTFMTAVSRMNENSILILEDIDSLFIERSSSGDNKSMVSFSCILNTLDGVGRKNKQLTFMTTNYKDKLDKALIRPGRIDKILHLDYANKYQIENMFLHFLPNQKANFESFWKQIKDEKLTTAILQQYLFRHRKDENILDYMDELKDIIDNHIENTNYTNIYM